MGKNKKEQKQNIVKHEPFLALRTTEGGKTLIIDIKDGKWSVEFPGELEESAATFADLLTKQFQSKFDKKVTQFLDIEAIGSVKIADKEYVVRIQKGEKTIGGKPVDDFLSELPKEDAISFMRKQLFTE